MLVNVGFARTSVVISQGDDVLFVKYIDVGGRQLDQSVAEHLDMKLSEATALRRHNGDRRADQQDPDVARAVAEAIRPVIERLSSELSMCLRYHSVTFRGQSLARLSLSGGEASPQLLQALDGRLNLKTELSDPLRSYTVNTDIGRRSQWNMAAGLALRN
jgi:type IV pilus assembly protein PilM